MYAFKRRGVDLEVEGVRYNYGDASRSAYARRPPPSRGGDLELEGGVSVFVKIWRDTWNTYLVWRLNVVVR